MRPNLVRVLARHHRHKCNDTVGVYVDLEVVGRPNIGEHAEGIIGSPSHVPMMVGKGPCSGFRRGR